MGALLCPDIDRDLEPTNADEVEEVDAETGGDSICMDDISAESNDNGGACSGALGLQDFSRLNGDSEMDLSRWVAASAGDTIGVRRIGFIGENG